MEYQKSSRLSIWCSMDISTMKKLWPSTEREDSGTEQKTRQLPRYFIFVSSFVKIWIILQWLKTFTKSYLDVLQTFELFSISDIKLDFEIVQELMTFQSRKNLDIQLSFRILKNWLSQFNDVWIQMHIGLRTFTLFEG